MSINMQTSACIVPQVHYNVTLYLIKQSDVRTICVAGMAGMTAPRKGTHFATSRNEKF